MTAKFFTLSAMRYSTWVCWQECWIGFEGTYLVLPHAVRIRVAAEAQDDEPFVLAEDGLVDVPAGAQVREHDGAHGYRAVV